MQAIFISLLMLSIGGSSWGHLSAKRKYNVEIILPKDRRANCLKIILCQIPNLECICTKRSQYHKLPTSTDLTFLAHKICCRTDLSSRRKEWRNNYNCRTSNVRAYTTGIRQIGRHWGRGPPKPLFLQISVSVNFIYPRIKYDKFCIICNRNFLKV